MVAALLAALMTGLGAVPRPAQAQPVPVAEEAAARDVFEARAVPVDATASTVAEARDRGLVQGRVAALRQVLDRIASRDDLARLPPADSAQVIDMVRDFSIANERSSAVRYLAELNVRFKPEAIRRLLRTAQIPFTEVMSKPLVVVPVMRVGQDAPQLWEDQNLWREAWSRLPPANGLVPLILPLGDALDIGTVGAEQALTKNTANLMTLSDRYKAGGVLVAAATMSGAGDTQAVYVALTEIRPNLAPITLAVSVPVGTMSPQEMVTAAAQQTMAAVNEDWKRRNRLEFGVTGQITALVPIAELKDWLTVKNRLDGVPLIDRIYLQALTRDRAQVTLYYAGDQDQLELAMSQHDLAITWLNNVWIVEAARSGVGTGRALGSPGAAPETQTIPASDTSPPPEPAAAQQ